MISCAARNQLIHGLVVIHHPVVEDHCFTGPLNLTQNNNVTTTTNESLFCVCLKLLPLENKHNQEEIATMCQL